MAVAAPQRDAAAVDGVVEIVGQDVRIFLNPGQVEEILLTAAQSLFAIVVLADFRFSLLEGIVFFVLFATQMISTSPEFRYYYSFLYLVLAIGFVTTRPRVRRSMWALLRGAPEEAGKD